MAEEIEGARAAILPLLAERRRLEHDLHALVFRLYDLTEDEIARVRRTAPPRDPLCLITGTAQPTAVS